MQRYSLMALVAHNLTSQCAFNFSTCSGILRLQQRPHQGKVGQGYDPTSCNFAPHVDRCGDVSVQTETGGLPLVGMA
jgi:hypothetical protein